MQFAYGVRWACDEKTVTDPQHTYRFEIDAWNPRELAMGRRAEYMGDLSRPFGGGDHIQFNGAEVIRFPGHEITAELRRSPD